MLIHGSRVDVWRRLKRRDVNLIDIWCWLAPGHVRPEPPASSESSSSATGEVFASSLLAGG